MKLDKALFEKVALQAKQSPRLRMHFDLRDSADENGQRMMNVSVHFSPRLPEK